MTRTVHRHVIDVLTGTCQGLEVTDADLVGVPAPVVDFVRGTVDELAEIAAHRGSRTAAEVLVANKGAIAGALGAGGVDVAALMPQAAAHADVLAAMCGGGAALMVVGEEV